MMGDARGDGSSLNEEDGTGASNAKHGREAADRGRDAGARSFSGIGSESTRHSGEPGIPLAKLYREGRLGKAEPATDSELVAVRILDEQQRSGVEQARKQVAVKPSLGMIQVESEKGRLCIQGAADPTTLGMVLERLLG